MTQTGPRVSAPPHAANAISSDYHAWSQEQGRLLRSGHFGRLDLENLAEEIEDSGKRER